MAFDYDLFVIGGGSGGVRAARLTSILGKKVGLCEEYRMGGTCVIRGCVPKKLMVYASKYSQDFKDAIQYGWSNDESYRHDWALLQKKIEDEVSRLSKIYSNNLQKAGVELFSDRGVIIDENTIELKNSGRRITAKHILIATGGTPFVPDIPGAEYVMTSNEIFLLKEKPESVLIVGGGYIASEFACIFNGLGISTTQVYRGAQILRGFDQDMQDSVSEAMVNNGIDLKLNTDVSAIEKTDSGYCVTLNNGDVKTVDQVFYATGRKPVVQDIGLEAVGIKLDASDAIVVDEYSKTSIDNIYAVGDVTNRLNLTPVAIREAVALVDTLYNDKPTAMDHNDIATAIFTQPEIGTVGLSEADAVAKYEHVDVYKAAFRPMKHILAGKDEKMVMKLIVSAQDNIVRGCHILGEASGEMIQLAAIAIKMKATKADFDATCAVHPTASEELVTMKEPSKKYR